VGWLGNGADGEAAMDFMKVLHRHRDRLDSQTEKVLGKELEDREKSGRSRSTLLLASSSSTAGRKAWTERTSRLLPSQYRSVVKLIARWSSTELSTPLGFVDACTCGIGRRRRCPSSHWQHT
jgi:hypothetical protein